ncbi:partial Putative HTH-type transcriptional regulator, partial [Planctomycetaceae bacterium]
MKRARAAQLGMLPKAPVIPGLEIHTYYEACDALGGDFYDFVALSPYELGIVMGDVSGHGIDAALLMAAAKKCIHIRSEGRSSPRETLLVAMGDLAHDIPNSSFISIFYGILDFRSASLKFASAGHTPPVLINSARQPVVTELRSKGVVFNPSVLDRLAEELSEETVPLKRGDILMLYTDGLSESMNAEREQYGELRLQQLLKHVADAPAEVIGQAVLRDVERFRGGVPRADDQTQIVLRYLDVKVPEGSAQTQQRPEATSNIGPDRTSFIGRERELGQLVELLSQPGRLVTLTGAAGIGKSRLALAAGRKLISRYTGGAWLIDLAEVQEPRDVLNRFAQILGIRGTGGTDLSDAITSTLRLRQPLLLILDNVEHLAKAGAELVRKWLDAVPELSVLSTSRMLLGVPGEREYRLQPLSIDEDRRGEAGSHSDAAALFCERAREIRPDYKFDAKSMEIVRAICAGVEGIPLAVELAAARLRVATLDQVLAQLRKPPPGAAARPVDAQSRRASMFDAVAWSYSLLSEAERKAFEQLCVFRGGFFLEDAEAVLRLGKPDGAQDPVTAVSGLYDKNLLNGVDTAFGRQFKMYAAIRDFGLEQAAAHMGKAEREDLLVRHIEYFGNTAFLEFQRRYGRDAIDALDLIEVQRENMMAALERAPALGLKERAAQAAMALGWYLLERGTAQEAIEVTERSVKLEASPTARQRLWLLHLQARLVRGVDPLLVRDSDLLVEQVAR